MFFALCKAFRGAYPLSCGSAFRPTGCALRGSAFRPTGSRCQRRRAEARPPTRANPVGRPSGRRDAPPVGRPSGRRGRPCQRRRAEARPTDPRQVLRGRPSGRRDALVVGRPSGRRTLRIPDHPSSARTSAAPAPSASSLARATSRGRGAMPQLVLGRSLSGVDEAERRTGACRRRPPASRSCSLATSIAPSMHLLAAEELDQVHRHVGVLALERDDVDGGPLPAAGTTARTAATPARGSPSSRCSP